jgi:hypothetical protein
METLDETVYFTVLNSDGKFVVVENVVAEISITCDEKTRRTNVVEIFCVNCLMLRNM